MSDWRTSASKVASVTATVPMAALLGIPEQGGKV
jgi:hypothetical protein